MPTTPLQKLDRWLAEEDQPAGHLVLCEHWWVAALTARLHVRGIHGVSVEPSTELPQPGAIRVLGPRAQAAHRLAQDVDQLYADLGYTSSKSGIRPARSSKLRRLLAWCWTRSNRR